MTYRTLLRELDMAELVEWSVFWELEPYGDEWRQIARLLQTMAIAAGLKKPGGGTWHEDDFMPAGYRAAKVQADPADAIEANLLGWAQATNSAAKKVKKKR